MSSEDTPNKKIPLEVIERIREKMNGDGDPDSHYYEYVPVTPKQQSVYDKPVEPQPDEAS
ncbi:MAG: hypothetical protein Q8L37_03755 [Candidatus Gottesmanbacteria bacterium]|nr:hypothetical protein [Candidatus Gottesmanbacteria bacterium]